MKEIYVKNITLMDEVETKEAITIYSSFRKKYIWFILVPLILLTIFLFANIIKFNVHLWIFCLLSFIAFVLGFIVYKTLMNPFRTLLKIAKRNDMVRHEEKIRESERQRLRQERESIYKISDIDNTANKENLQE